MVSALDSGSRGLGSSPGRRHCVVFLGETLYSHSASLHPGVQMGTGELNGLASHPGGSKILPVTSCYRNRDKFWPDGPLGPYVARRASS